MSASRSRAPRRRSALRRRSSPDGAGWEWSDITLTSSSSRKFRPSKPSIAVRVEAGRSRAQCIETFSRGPQLLLHSHSKPRRAVACAEGQQTCPDGLSGASDTLKDGKARGVRTALLLVPHLLGPVISRFTDIGTTCQWSSGKFSLRAKHRRADGLTTSGDLRIASGVFMGGASCLWHLDTTFDVFVELRQFVLGGLFLDGSRYCDRSNPSHSQCRQLVSLA